MSGSHSRLDTAAVDSKDRIQRAIADQAGYEWYHANPAPCGLRTNENQAQQPKAETYAQDAINFAFVLERHDISPLSVLNEVCN